MVVVIDEKVITTLELKSLGIQCEHNTNTGEKSFRFWERTDDCVSESKVDVQNLVTELQKLLDD